MALKKINSHQLLNDDVLDSIYFDEQPSLALHTATMGALLFQNNLYMPNAQAVLAYNQKYEAKFPTYTPILWAASHYLQASTLSSIEDQTVNFVSTLLQVSIPTILVIDIKEQYATLPTFEDVKLFIESVSRLLCSQNQYILKMLVKGNASDLDDIFCQGDNFDTYLWLEKVSSDSDVLYPKAWDDYLILEYEENVHCFNQALTTAPQFIRQLHNLAHQFPNRGSHQAMFTAEQHFFARSFTV